MSFSRLRHWRTQTHITLGDILCIYLQQKSLDSVLRFPFFCCTRNVADQLKSQFVPGQTGGLQAGHVLASVLLRIAGKPLATPLAGQTLRSCRQSDLQRFKALGPRRIEDWLRIRRCPDIALPILHCPHVPCTI
jgi:hypothetical protein